MSRDILVVGSGFAAQLAMGRLGQLSWNGRLLHLPSTDGDEEFQVSKADIWGDASYPVAKSVRLTDVWGKILFKMELPHLRLVGPFPGSHTLQLPASKTKVESLPQGLELSRTSAADDGYLATLSDGSQMLCQGVLFADGVDSQSRKFWNQLKRTSDRAAKLWSL